jgi:hypothetical protein
MKSLFTISGVLGLTLMILSFFIQEPLLTNIKILIIFVCICAAIFGTLAKDWSAAFWYVNTIIWIVNIAMFGNF